MMSRDRQRLMAILAHRFASWYLLDSPLSHVRIVNAICHLDETRLFKFQINHGKEGKSRGLTKE
jgi:hypothetical protein